MHRRHCHNDHVFFVDGLKVTEGPNDDLTLAKFLKAKMKSLNKPVNASSFVEVEQVEKSTNGRPLTLRVISSSDWTKRRIFRCKSELKGSDVYLREFLDKDMEDLSYQVRIRHKMDCFSHYCVRKDHVLLISGPGFPGVKVYNQDQLIEAEATSSKSLYLMHLRKQRKRRNPNVMQKRKARKVQRKVMMTRHQTVMMMVSLASRSCTRHSHRLF